MIRRIVLATVAGAVGLSLAAQPQSWWSGPQVTLLGSPSPDGASLSFVEPGSGALAVRDLRNGTWKAVAARPSGSKEFAHFSVFSRDGRRVAYAWFNEQGFYELRVAAAAGGSAPVVAYRNPQAGFVQPCAWTPDNRYILTLLFRKDNISQIAMVPAEGGTPRVLRSLNWVYPKRMDLSPDGAWVVYDNFAAEGSPERTIFVLSADGSDERRLVDRPGNFLFPLWAPDGKRVYFAGDTGGAPELWALDMADGGSRGEPFVVAHDLGRFLPIGITRGGDLFYGVRTGMPDLSLVPVDGEKAAASRLVNRFPGRNLAPAWSHDGKRIAWLSRRDTENFGEDARAIVIHEVASGEEREVPARLAHIERLAWSPDGTSLLASGSDGKGRGGVFLVRVADGATTPVAAEPGGPFRGFEAVWPSGGSRIYYLHGDRELRSHDLRDGHESVVLRTAAMRHLAVNPAGDTLAIGIGGSAIRITPLVENATARLVPFPGIAGLAWAGELLAIRGEEVWSVPANGDEPRRITRLPELLPVFAVSPGGHTLCLAAGREQAEIRSLHLP